MNYLYYLTDIVTPSDKYAEDLKLLLLINQPTAAS